jgi:hypothetical protein
MLRITLQESTRALKPPRIILGHGHSYLGLLDITRGPVAQLELKLPPLVAVTPLETPGDPREFVPNPDELRLTGPDVWDEVHRSLQFLGQMQVLIKVAQGTWLALGRNVFVFVQNISRSRGTVKFGLMATNHPGSTQFSFMSEDKLEERKEGFLESWSKFQVGSTVYWWLPETESAYRGTVRDIRFPGAIKPRTTMLLIGAMQCSQGAAVPEAQRRWQRANRAADILKDARNVSSNLADVLPTAHLEATTGPAGDTHRPGGSHHNHGGPHRPSSAAPPRRPPSTKT